MTKTKILMVDDHALVRQALGDRLEKESALEVVGTASTADEASASPKLCQIVVCTSLCSGQSLTEKMLLLEQQQKSR